MSFSVLLTICLFSSSIDFVFFFFLVDFLLLFTLFYRSHHLRRHRHLVYMNLWSRALALNWRIVSLHASHDRFDFSSYAMFIRKWIRRESKSLQFALISAQKSQSDHRSLVFFSCVFCNEVVDIDRKTMWNNRFRICEWKEISHNENVIRFDAYVCRRKFETRSSMRRRKSHVWKWISASFFFLFSLFSLSILRPICESWINQTTKLRLIHKWKCNSVVLCVRVCVLATQHEMSSDVKLQRNEIWFCRKAITVIKIFSSRNTNHDTIIASHMHSLAGVALCRMSTFECIWDDNRNGKRFVPVKSKMTSKWFSAFQFRGNNKWN